MDVPSAQALDELNSILRQALPEAWRNDLETTISPEGFTFRFRDGEGRPHALDVRSLEQLPTPLVAGTALGYSYTSLGPSLDEAAVLDGCRAVLTALAAREEELLRWMPDPAGPAEVTALPWRGPKPGERPAPAELVAVVTAELPEAWRADLSVSLTAGGFVLQFVDEAGVRHALDAREIRPDAPTLVNGRVLSFSYLFVEGGVEETALAGEYRAVLSRLAAREDALLPWITAEPPADGPSVTAPLSEQAAAALPDEHAAPPELAAILRDALPEQWRHAVIATLSPGGFLLRFRDADGRQHALDARELRLAATPFVAGDTLGYSYTLVDPTLDEASVLDGYRAVLTALAAREADILPWLSRSPDEAAGLPNAVASEHSWKGPFPNETPAPGELTTAVSDALPAGWRHDLAVSLTPDGFIARFRDAKGMRHAFDAREIRPDAPTLVSGRVLAFSYLSLEEGAEETALAGEYRAALAALATRENDLLPWLSLASMKAPAYYPSAPPNDPLIRPAAPELVVIVAEALPEAWRRDLDVTLTAHGFVARLRDEQDAWHTLYVHEIHPDAPALLTGKALAYAYLLLDGQAEDAAHTEQYRAALQNLLDREERILPWLREDMPARPASPGLLSLVDELLPAPWRSSVEVVLGVDGFTLSFRDGGNVRHMLEVRLLSAGRPSLVRGEQLGFAYRKVDAALDDTVMVQRYREALQGFVAREAEVVTRMQETA